MLVAGLLVSTALTTAPSVQFDVASGTGLTVRYGAIPVVQGSWFQLYEPDWSRGYYASGSATQTVQRISDREARLQFRSADGLASGEQTFRQEGNQVRVKTRIEWTGPRPIKLEITPGMIWTVPFSERQVPGNPWQELTAKAPTGNDIAQRQFTPSGRAVSLRGDAVQVEVAADRTVIAFDARQYPQPWAAAKPLVWTGQLGVDLFPGVPFESETTFTLSAGRAAEGEAAASASLPFVATPTSRAQVGSGALLPLIPKPKSDGLEFQKPVFISGKWTLPAGRFRGLDTLNAALARRFDLSTNQYQAAVAVEGGESRLFLRPGGFRITIRPGLVSVFGQDSEGLRTGIERLAQLAFVVDGKLALPTGTLIDEPRREWRGVHLFVGPTAPAFHERLWTRVLRPLGFNKVVLQAEQTAWDAVPGIRTPITMSKADLARLGAMYRGMDVEVIPLIQSLGHMEWFFANGQHRDLAVNPDIPYTIDPRKPATHEIMRKIWDEAIAVLKPQTVHFGLDEIDMLGMPKENPALATELWSLMMPTLEGISKKHGVRGMIWGDMGLAPGEAVDAAHGANPEEARRRRDAIPKQWYIGDWHYPANPSPSAYERSLRVWQREAFRPIASMWFEPDNIRGFSLAADLANVGTLQTTWAGYESSEANMRRAFEQFSAMVLAADYSWSGRSEMPRDLPYNPAHVFRSMFYDRPSPIQPRKGFAVGDGPERVVGNFVFREWQTPVTFWNAMTPARRGPQEATVRPNVRGSNVVLALQMNTPLDRGSTLGEVVVEAEGEARRVPLVYGTNLRAAGDPGLVLDAVGDGLYAVEVRLAKPARVNTVRIRSTSEISGLSWHGLTVF